MGEKHYVVDNRRERLVDHLRTRLRDVDTLRIVSAYFSIYGYELLAEELDAIPRTRFLFGDPESLAHPDPAAQGRKTFELTEGGLEPRHQLQQTQLARRCARWLGNSAVEVRSIRESNFLHGKLYHLEGRDGGAAVVGSSNFSRRGLGAAGRPNLEINLSVAGGGDQWTDLGSWFDELWADDLVRDAKRDVLDALHRLGKEQAPEFVYYKTLFELFREELDSWQEGDQAVQAARLSETELWRQLYDFQKDAARTIIGRLERQGGCILADSVGLGKTWTALAVIKYYEIRHNAKVLVLCPKKLSPNWTLYPAASRRASNPFSEDDFRFSTLAHTDLSRDRGASGGIDLENFDWNEFRLVVIDESHNFRNASASRVDEHGATIRVSRYERLRNLIAQGGKTDVLMLSATPVNTSLSDLRGQIDLATNGQPDAFEESLAIDDYHAVLADAQTRFRQWEQRSDRGSRKKTDLVTELGAEFKALLGGVSVARSRRHIENSYQNAMAEIGAFPAREAPVNRYPPTDSKGELSYEDLNRRISDFRLAIYTPSSFVVGGKAREALEREKKRFNFNQADRERFLIGMIRTNFLKRLESSAHALALTLERTIDRIDGLQQRLNRFAAAPPDARGDETVFDHAMPMDDEEDEEFLVNRGRHRFHLRDLDLSAWGEALREDRAVLTTALESVGRIDAARDGKLAALREAIRQRARNPTRDRQGKENRKLLVFTTFKDTAEYLYENLADLAAELGLAAGMVAGDATRCAAGKGGYDPILDRFAPRGRQTANLDALGGEIDLLFATDCVSEGQNLQDCDRVLNYDIHWNPVRLVQRFGRIDRIGSASRSVGMINFWPTDDLDLYLRLKNRVEARMALADAAATGDDDQLNPQVEGDAQMVLTFRDEQLKRMKREMVDLEDADEGVSLSDFTLDQYVAKLLAYLESRREELESTPNGVYAIVPASEAARAGAIFLLRSRKNASPLPVATFPHFLVYVRASGAAGIGCQGPSEVLDLFGKLAEGRAAPVQELCDRFERETRNGSDMAAWDELLGRAVRDITGELQRQIVRRMGRRGFRIPTAGDRPLRAGDFELVSWLIVMAEEGEKRERRERNGR